MGAGTNRPNRSARDNVGLVQQLVYDVSAGCFEGCTITITARGKGGARRKVVGPIDRVDLKEEMIYINEAQATEGVGFKDIISYRWPM